LKVKDLIGDLKTSGLYAICPCGKEFAIADCTIFDGTKEPFPKVARDIQDDMKEDFAAEEEEFTRQVTQITERTAKTAAAVNIGKSLEKILPMAKDFKWVVPDTKFLGDPIDLLIFNGLSEGKVESLSFVEVKSGSARLNTHQKAIRDAIMEHRVSYGVFK